MGNAKNPWVARLRQYVELEADDCERLDELIANPRNQAGGTDIISHGEEPAYVHVIVEGFACRYKMLADGRRQIMAYLLPGDPCDLHVFLLNRMDHGIAALTPSKVALVPREVILEITERRPKLTRALWWATLVDEAILREWLVNIGRRGAYERVGHLLWELYLRHKAIGLAEGHAFSLPLTQQDLADTVGLSNVHVNRSLQRLRGEKIIESTGRTVKIVDPEALRTLSNFEPDYLHLADRRR